MLLLIFLCLFPTAASEAHGNSFAPTLREKDIRRGEAIITQLRRLEQSSAASIDFRNTLVNKLYPGLFVKVSELRDSDLKTDLTTAVFLYEQSFHELKDSDSTLNCEDELRSVYAKLCASNQSGTVRELLRAKARLHTDWANALIKYQHGSRDAVTTATLEEIQRERQNDLTLAGKALTALKSLEKQVYSYASLAEFEEHGALAKVPFEQLSGDASRLLRSVDRILDSLPRSPLFYPLYSARNFYSDGLFWWQKTYRRKKMVVDVNSLAARDEFKLLALDAQVVNYTVAINWRNAVKRTRQAENIIEATKIK